MWAATFSGISLHDTMLHKKRLEKVNVRKSINLKKKERKKWSECKKKKADPR